MHGDIPVQTLEGGTEGRWCRVGGVGTDFINSAFVLVIFSVLGMSFCELYIVQKLEL